MHGVRQSAKGSWKGRTRRCTLYQSWPSPCTPLPLDSDIALICMVSLSLFLSFFLSLWLLNYFVCVTFKWTFSFTSCSLNWRAVHSYRNNKSWEQITHECFNIVFVKLYNVNSFNSYHFFLFSFLLSHTMSVIRSLHLHWQSSLSVSLCLSISPSTSTSALSCCVRVLTSASSATTSRTSKTPKGKSLSPAVTAIDQVNKLLDTLLLAQQEEITLHLT